MLDDQLASALDKIFGVTPREQLIRIILATKVRDRALMIEAERTPANDDGGWDKLLT